MKVEIITLLFTMLIFRSSASFFDDITGAVSSVQDNFGKMLTDVITDVSDTIDCSILALERAFNFGGVYSRASEYERKCKKENEQKVTPTDVHDETYSIKELKTDHVVDVDLNEALFQVNKDLRIVIDEGYEVKKKLQNIRNILETETDLLHEISSLLRRMLDNLSKDLRDRFQIHAFVSEPSIETIWNEMKVLRKIKDDNRDSPEAEEINHVFNQVLDVLEIQKTNDATGEETIDLLINNFEKESNRKNEEIKEQILDVVEINTEGKPMEILGINESVNENHVPQENTTDSEFARSFRDVVKTINEQLQTNVSFPSQRTELETPLVTTSKTTELLTTTELPLTESVATSIHYEEPFDYADLFDMGSHDEAARKKSLEEAKNMIENTKYSEKFMNSYLNSDTRDINTLFDGSSFAWT